MPVTECEYEQCWCVCVHTCLSMYLCVYTVCVCALCLRLCLREFLCVCVCVCKHICIHTSKHIYICCACYSGMKVCECREPLYPMTPALSTCLSLKCLRSSIKSHLTLQSLEREVIDMATIYGPLVCSSLYLSFTASPLFQHLQASTRTFTDPFVPTNTLKAYFLTLKAFLTFSSPLLDLDIISHFTVYKYKGMKVYK